VPVPDDDVVLVLPHGTPDPDDPGLDWRTSALILWFVAVGPALGAAVGITLAALLRR
jgi:asparagine N-glycosylation enzyme membrane subunit Stt3